MMKQPIGIRIGVEQEFVFKNTDEEYIDFENGSYKLFQSIVDLFPAFETDKTFFECKSLETVPKRCYIEGIERYDEDGFLVKTTPKGLEIRTRPHYDIDELIAEFADSFLKMVKISETMGLYPVSTSSHPFKIDTLGLYNSLHAIEIEKRGAEDLDHALFSMLFHGMHCNISIDNYTRSDLKQLVNKLNFYLPYMIPYSFSSPFYDSKLFVGESSRTYFHAPKRKLVKLVERNSVDIIHFAGFDSCADKTLLKGVLELLCSVIESQTLNHFAIEQDVSKIQEIALHGFENPIFKAECIAILDNIQTSININFTTYEYLKKIALSNDTYSSKIKKAFIETNSIMESISNQYNFGDTS